MKKGLSIPFMLLGFVSQHGPKNDSIPIKKGHANKPGQPAQSAVLDTIWIESKVVALAFSQSPPMRKRERGSIICSIFM